MKRVMTVLLLMGILSSYTEVNAQVFADFENEADSLQGFYDAAWFGPMSQFERIEDPTGRSGYVVACGLDGQNQDRGVIQSHGRFYGDAGIASMHVYLPANFPDSAIISLWGDDPYSGWSWNATEIFGIDVPKEQWWPLYFYMEQLAIMDPENFDWVNSDTLAHFGVQFFFNDTSYSGTVLIDDAEFMDAEVFADFENAEDGLTGFFDAAWFGPMSQFERIEDPTGRSGYVVACGLDRSLHDRGVVQSFKRFYGDAGVASIRIYLPADMPDDVGIAFWGDDLASGWNWNATSYGAGDIPRETWWPIYFEMERTGIQDPINFGWVSADTLEHLGLQFWIGSQDSTYTGTVLIDEAGFAPKEMVATAIYVDKTHLPITSKLLGNYPNPFNPSTTIEFEINSLQNVQVNVYDVTGQLVKTLYKGLKTAGLHQLQWDSTNNFGQEVGSGLYFYTLTADKFSQTKKMILIR